MTKKPVPFDSADCIALNDLKLQYRADGTNQKDFWVAIRALKTESFLARIDTILPRCIPMSSTIEDGGRGRKKPGARWQKIILLDQARTTPYPHLDLFPHSCRDCARLARIACFVPLTEMPVLGDDRLNAKLRTKGIALVGFDPERFASQNYWSTAARDYPLASLELDEHTLRPKMREQSQQYSYPMWYKSAQRMIGDGKPFVSVFRRLAEYIRKNGTMPTLDELMYFILKREETKTNELVFLKDKLVSRPRTLRRAQPTIILPQNLDACCASLLYKIRAFKLTPNQIATRLELKLK